MRQNVRPWSGSNLFYTQMVFLKEFFEKIDFEKNQQMTKKHEKFPRGKELRMFIGHMFICTIKILSAHHRCNTHFHIN